MREHPSQAQHMGDLIHRFVSDQASRLEVLSAEAGRLESKLVEGGSAALDESARLAKESLGRAMGLAAAYRRLALDLAQRLVRSMGPRV